jgi:hypothetical protein
LNIQNLDLYCPPEILMNLGKCVVWHENYFDMTMKEKNQYCENCRKECEKKYVAHA